MRFRIKNDSGIIIVVTLWMLIILTLLAVGIGYRNSIGIKLGRYNIDRLKTYYIAKAGLLVAFERMQKDTNDYDTLYECGFELKDNETPEDIFKDIELSEGFYTISYEQNLDGNKRIIYGLSDEQGKINLNAITINNKEILESLLIFLEVDTETAKIIASSVVDWRDTDSDVTNLDYGAEDDYYMGLEKSYYCKNSNFESAEELLLVKGMTKEIFSKIKDYITVFPLTAASLKINVNTASYLVLLALARAGAELDGNPQTTFEDIYDLSKKIVDYRAGDDNIEITADDRQIDIENPGDLDLFSTEESVFIYLRNNFFVENSGCFRVEAKGIYQDKKVVSEIEAVFSRGEIAPLYWHEN